ncbi:MAG TPA: helix-turn-helix domain-containing protein [Candidatus Syntrophoarchaeum butanivorans]|uniref:Helix-turn-helix domain-containing protein n=1 Tax=Candidatus Syntropharchaeum butanivorans TaxID=1839936 RepID=A0A7C1BAN8_9EURY|nr:MAG: helix-turn-helix domain-containing protein [Candidatus Syntrophoarchaeum sp. WYZ-LMO15]HDM36582.1 helix-turn-helix domain-containing protein [Candidatus Syntrophoarchaeum butanivorans]
MGVADELISEVFGSNKEFSSLLRRTIKQRLGMTVGEFSERSGIPVSTLYKILSGERDPNLRTLRRIINTIKEIEGVKKGRFIAVIASRGILDNIEMREVSFGDKSLDIREYAVTTMEDAIIAAVQAERDGAAALVCAPICSPTVEKIIRIPVATIKPKGSVIEAIKLAVRKAD